MAIPAQALFKLMTPTSNPSLLSNATSELLKFTSTISNKTDLNTTPPHPFSLSSMNNNAALMDSMMMSPNKCDGAISLISSPSSASKRNKRKSLEPKKVNTLDIEGAINNNNGMIRKLNFDHTSNTSSTALSATNRYFESSSPSGNSQKSDVSVDSGNSSSCCRSPSPDSPSPKRSSSSSAPPKKRFKEDPTLNLVVSDVKDPNEKQNNFDTKKVVNPFRPWGDCDKEEEINDDEDECFVDVERQSPIPGAASLTPTTESRLFERNLQNANPNIPVGHPSLLLGAMPTLESPPAIPSLPIAPQLITANHQQLVQASQNLLTLSKLYPNLVDMNALASVAAAAQLAASTAAVAAAASTSPTNLSPLQPQVQKQSLLPQAPNRPHLAGIQEQYSRIEPEQEEPLALIKKPTLPEAPEKSVQPINYALSKKISSLKENHQPIKPIDLTRVTDKNDMEKKGSKKSSSSATEKTSQQQRNYKNMTRERRVEANARERQRVHTITAAFDTLQSLIPSPEDITMDKSSSSSSDTVSQLSNLNNQKLSKLSIIKIATSYIMLLSRMAGYDYTEDKSAPSIEECVKKCSELLTQETKVKRSRDTILKVENKA